MSCFRVSLGSALKRSTDPAKLGKVFQTLLSVASGRALATTGPHMVWFCSLQNLVSLSPSFLVFLLLIEMFLEFMITEEGKVKVIPEHHRKKERLKRRKIHVFF